MRDFEGDQSNIELDVRQILTYLNINKDRWAHCGLSLDDLTTVSIEAGKVKDGHRASGGADE